MGPTIATEFSAAAECVGAQVIDQELVEGGPGPSIYRALAQLCARAEDAGLEDFMVRNYGEGRGGFEAVTLAGRDAYRLVQDTQTIHFLASERSIFQVVTMVETDPELEEVRKLQVGELLASLTID